MATGVKEEDEAKTTKRLRQKETTTVPAAVESPVAKPAAKRAARGMKATNDPPAEPEMSPVAVPSPRRTRRLRI